MADDVDAFFKQMQQEEMSKIHKVKVIYQTATVAPTSSSAAPTTTSTISSNTISSPVLSHQDDVSPQEALQSIQRDLNCLDPNTRREARIGAIKNIEKILVGKPAPYLKILFRPNVYQPIIKLFHDSVEFCREASLRIILDLVNGLKKDAESSWGYIFPVIISKWHRKDNVFDEGSEEVRLFLMKLLTAYVKYCHAAIQEYPSYLEDICDKILIPAYSDFHEVKKEACTCTIELCKVMQHIKLKSVELMKQLTPNLVHQRSDVRVSAIKALSQLVLHGAYSNLEELEPTLKLLSYDHAMSVKEVMLQTANLWLRELDDRYSYNHIILPILLILISDESEQLRVQAYQCVEELGKIYLDEHDEDKFVKDLKPYSVEETMETNNHDLLPHPFTGRPSLGSRLYVREFDAKILTKTLENMNDWNIKKRMVSTRLLKTILIFSENDLTASTDRIISNFVKLVKDDDESVRKEILDAIKLAGRFLDPKAYLTHVFSYFKSEYATTTNTPTNALILLANLLKGAKTAQITPFFLDKELKEKVNIIHQLSTPHLLYSEHAELRVALYEVLQVLVHLLGGTIAANQEDSYSLFILLIKIISVPATPQSCVQTAQQLITSLAQYSGFYSTDQLVNQHLQRCLGQDLLEDVEKWDRTSNNLYAVDFLLRVSVPTTVAHFGIVLPLIKQCLVPKRDSTVRLTIFNILNHVISHPVAQQLPTEVISSIISEVVIPNSVWKNGKTAAQVRKAAMKCLHFLLLSNRCNQDHLQFLSKEDSFKHISECLDEDDTEIRLVTTQLLKYYLQQTSTLLNSTQWIDISRSLLQRMDDKDDNVRRETAKTMISLFDNLPIHFDEKVFSDTIEVLLLHLDDPRVQQSVFELLSFVKTKFSSLEHTTLSSIFNIKVEEAKTKQYNAWIQRL